MIKDKDSYQCANEQRNYSCLLSETLNESILLDKPKVSILIGLCIRKLMLKLIY